MPDSSPAPTAPPAPEWTPPDTLNEKLSRWSRTAVKVAVTVIGLLLLATFVIWLVPAIVLSRSAEYRLAVEHAQNDPALRDELGPPLQAAWTPYRYVFLSPTHVRLGFVVRGSTGWSEHVGVEVKDGKVVGGAPMRFLDY